MDTALYVVEIIFFVIAAISILSMLIFNIIDRIHLKKLEKENQETVVKIINSIQDAINKAAEKEKVKDNSESKKKTKTTNYSDMNILSLREIAKKKKIKGYYNLHKEELVKKLEETV